LATLEEWEGLRQRNALLAPVTHFDFDHLTLGILLGCESLRSTGSSNHLTRRGYHPRILGINRFEGFKEYLAPSSYVRACRLGHLQRHLVLLSCTSCVGSRAPKSRWRGGLETSSYTSTFAFVSFLSQAFLDLTKSKRGSLGFGTESLDFF
jgi:hypothetical protein